MPPSWGGISLLSLRHYRYSSVIILGMEVSLKNNSTTESILTITVDPKEIEEIKKKVLRELASGLKVPGFRKGHVPAAVVEKNIDSTKLNQEVLNQAVTEAYQKAIQEKKLEVLDRPEINITSFDDKGLSFTATIPIMPEIKLYDYTKIKKKAKSDKVTEKEIDEVIENLQTRASTYKEVDRKSKNGDRIWIDFEGFDNKDQPFKGGKGDNYPLALGSNTFIPGFEEGLVGFKKGNETELNLSFPKTYHEKSLAGKKVKFKVKVNKVEETEKPKLDKAFLKQFGDDIKTVDDLKKDIREQMQAEKDIRANKDLQDEIINELVEKSKFDVPEVLIKDQQQMLIYDSEQNLKYRGTTLEDSLKQEGLTKDEWIDRDVKPEAEKRVRIGIVISEVAKKEDIKVSEKEIDARLSLMREQYATNGEALKQLDDPRMRGEIASRVATEKAINRLVEISSK